MVEGREYPKGGVRTGFRGGFRAAALWAALGFGWQQNPWMWCSEHGGPLRSSRGPGARLLGDKEGKEQLHHCSSWGRGEEVLSSSPCFPEAGAWEWLRAVLGRAWNRLPGEVGDALSHLDDPLTIRSAPSQAVGQADPGGSLSSELFWIQFLLGS